MSQLKRKEENLSESRTARVRKPFGTADDAASDEALDVSGAVSQFGEDRRCIGANTRWRRRTRGGFAVEREPRRGEALGLPPVPLAFVEAHREGRRRSMPL